MSVAEELVAKRFAALDVGVIGVGGAASDPLDAEVTAAALACMARASDA